MTLFLIPRLVIRPGIAKEPRRDREGHCICSMPTQARDMAPVYGKLLSGKEALKPNAEAGNSEQNRDKQLRFDQPIAF